MLSSLVRFYGGEGFKNPRNFRNGCVYFSSASRWVQIYLRVFFSSSRWVLSYYQEYKTSEITCVFLACRYEFTSVSAFIFLARRDGLEAITKNTKLAKITLYRYESFLGNLQDTRARIMRSMHLPISPERKYTLICRTCTRACDNSRALAVPQT